MNLKRQLLLVSLLTLVLPWAGCQFIRETESALRSGQQQLLAGTARAIADSLAQYELQFPLVRGGDRPATDSLYGHRLRTAPGIDGYFDDWSLDREALQRMPGADGDIRFALGLHEQFVYLYVEVSDDNVIYAAPGMIAVGSDPADRVALVNTSPPYLDETLIFGAEAPGPTTPYVRTSRGFAADPSIAAFWQDAPSSGYHLEARIPANRLGTHIGLLVGGTNDPDATAVRSASYTAAVPGVFVTASDELTAVAQSRIQPGMRLILTDAVGWRIASAGDVDLPENGTPDTASAWLRIAYEALVEPGQEAELAKPAATGLETQDYIVDALRGKTSETWFRSPASGEAVVAVAQPVFSGNTIIGALVLQQGTDAILSLTNQGLARLMYVTVIATLLVAAGLLGYASWLSRRIRRLSVAAETALEADGLWRSLPSADSRDEVGDLSRTFSHVLRQLGDYNAYLRTLASKLSHELRTPLAIVTSSLENLEHEALSPASAEYAARARTGADRLRRILSAMSEASRVEELMEHAEPVRFDLHAVLESTVAAYRDAYPARQFDYVSDERAGRISGSPELLTQMLDKLVDNAVDFSREGDVITLQLTQAGTAVVISVTNPGPHLPERMRSQMFDSMVSMRDNNDDSHLGLGLYVARLIAEGHGGSLQAGNVDGGVQFRVRLPQEAGGEA